MKSHILTRTVVGSTLALILLAVFTYPGQPRILHEKVNFHVLESDALFFKNLRQFYYDKQVREDAGYELFFHPDQKIFADWAPRLVIVNNWKMDEAYITFQTRNGDQANAKLRLATTNEKEVIDLKNANVLMQLELAVSLYQCVNDEKCQMEISQNDSWTFLWSTRDERLVVKTILKDYFKLVGAI